MVGVAGKSKGCQACRQKKTKCGQEKPACNQCTRSNRPCSYQRATKFIQYSTPETAQDNLPRTASLIQISYRQHILDEFNTHCTPDSTSTSWLTQLLRIPIETSALESSQLALSTALVGQKRSNPVLIRESLQLYTRGLRQLQAALNNTKLMRHDETLAACLALMMYEIAECPAKHAAAYHQHCKGLLSLVKMRGVHAHSSGLGHRLFLAVRLQGILYDLGQQVPSFMGDDAWVEIPWMNECKRPVDRIIDVIARIPRIHHDIKILPHMTPEEQEYISIQLITKFNSLNFLLDNIYSQIKQTTSGPLFWPALSRGFFPLAFQFPSLKTAGTLMMYWTARALLYSASSNLPTGNPNPPHDISPLITNICQSTEFCLQEHHLLLGAYIASTPLVICLAVLGNSAQNHQTAWIRATLEKLENRGLRILKYQ